MSRKFWWQFGLMASTLISPAFAQTKTIKLKTFTGEELEFRIQDGQPFPTESSKIKIEVAGFNVGPSKDDSKQPKLTWMFGFTSKTKTPIAEVMIEDVPPNKPAEVVVQDSSPTLKDGVWSGSRAPLNTSADSIPWLYSEKASVFIFRFKIRYADGQVETLHQLAIFSKPAKDMFVKMIKDQSKSS